MSITILGLLLNGSTGSPFISVYLSSYSCNFP